MAEGENIGRNADGTFARGNPGRPRGARHRSTRAMEELLDGEAEALTRKAIDLALGGDVTALRLCLDRISPAKKDAAVSFELPAIETASDAVAASQAVIAAVSDGEITPSEGAAVMALVEQFRRVLEISELEHRIAALEADKQ